MNYDATDAQRATYKEIKKKECKSLFLIHQSVDDTNFDRISTAATFAQAWDILEGRIMQIVVCRCVLFIKH